MDTATQQRFRSGELCIETGWYEFDGYVNGEPQPLPMLAEMEVARGVGDVFPSIRSTKRPCFWILAGGVVEQPDSAARKDARGG
jgi:hypothetical protein